MIRRKTKGTHLNFAISRSKRAIRFGVASSGIVGTEAFWDVCAC